jgi:hypothetical protein
MTDGLPERVRALRHRPKTVAAAVVVLALGAYAWGNRKSETWVQVSPGEMNLAVGASQPLAVAIRYKPPLIGRTRSIAGTIQLISFPVGVDVVPTSLVTSGDAPEAVLRVTGLRPGDEELIVAGSNRPSDERSWLTAAVQVVVTGPARRGP